MQAFKHIFTSLSSADSENLVDDADQEEGTSMELLLKCQEGLTVQLHFALSSCNAWCLIHEDFDYNKISDLLYCSVFGHSNASVYHPQPVEKKLVASTLRK
ncbi:hypothetical protein V8B97DRAFT_2027062 [Scleroderma yunnanense]